MGKIIIGNIVALIASLIMVYSGIIKTKNKIVYIQGIQIGLSVISNAILGGITGAIINALNFVRNILCYKDRLGLIGILPLISTVVYLWLMNIIKHQVILLLLMRQAW